jgi:hypothetical protein
LAFHQNDVGTCIGAALWDGISMADAGKIGPILHGRQQAAERAFPGRFSGRSTPRAEKWTMSQFERAAAPRAALVGACVIAPRGDHVSALADAARTGGHHPANLQNGKRL